MKILKIALLSCLCFLITNPLYSQDEVENWEGKIVLDGTDLEKEIRIKVDAKSTEIRIKVDGKISGGKLMAKLIDPEGNSKANLNLKAGKGSKAMGWLEEAVNASPGTWVVKIINKEATGKVNVKVKQN